MKQMVLEKKAILVVSFGTSYNETREATIGAVERKVAETFPDYEVRRAFTSQVIINKLKARDGEKTDNVNEALERLAADGVTRLIVQPTHVMNGYEYEDMMKAVTPYISRFPVICCGKPLLSSDSDYEEMVAVLTEETAAYRTDTTAVVCMGHGTSHEANAAYARLNGYLRGKGYFNYYIGTVEGTPSLGDVVEEIKLGNYDRVLLLPLMIVAGDHACNDMAGAGKDSWRSVFQSEGYQVECILKGMGEYQGIQTMFCDHVRHAVSYTET